MSDDPYSKPLVLVIDDDESIRAYLSALTQDHAETIEAASGDKGISVAKSRVPDLILLDLMMPGTDGYQVCKALKQNTATKHIPVIFITAQTDRAFEAAALKLGAIDYIVKPFDTDIVATKIKNHLEIIRRGETINPTFQRRVNTRYLGIAAAMLVAAALGFATHIYLSETDTSTETVPAPTVQALQPAQNASALPAAQPAPSSTTTSPPLTAKMIAPSAPGPTTPAPPQQRTTRSIESFRQETNAVTDRKHPRPTDHYGWVKAAHCGVVPLVEWWQNITPSSMAVYVDQYHDGIWEPYAIKWERHLIKAENIMARGGALKAPNGKILRGPPLQEFVAKLRKRVDVVECLSRAAARRASSAQ